MHRLYAFFSLFKHTDQHTCREQMSYLCSIILTDWKQRWSWIWKLPILIGVYNGRKKRIDFHSILLKTKTICLFQETIQSSAKCAITWFSPHHLLIIFEFFLCLVLSGFDWSYNIFFTFAKSHTDINRQNLFAEINKKED